jgi:hypothetical protein
MSELVLPTIHGRGSNLTVSHGDDTGLYVTFYMESVEHPFESQQAGRAIFRDVPYVRIVFPGNRSTEVKRPAKFERTGDMPYDAPLDSERWPKQWQAFKNQAAEVHEGTPILEWPPLTKAVAMNLKAMNVHTVEQLAALPDNALTWLGARDLREKAITWLKNATGGAEVTRLKAQNDALKTDIEALKQQFAELAAQRTKRPKAQEETA